MSDMDLVNTLTQSVDALGGKVGSLAKDVQADRAAAVAAKSAADRAARKSTIKIRLLALLTILDVALSLAVVLGYFKIRDVTDCQDRVSAESRASIEARSQYADVSTGADLAFLDSMEKSILDTPAGATQTQRADARAEFLAAIRAKRETTIKARQVRAENPVTAEGPGC